MNAIAFWTVLFSVANTNVLFLITSMLFTRALYIKFSQTLTIISTLNCRGGRRWTERKLLWEFRRHYTSTLGYFFAGNRHFGRIFLALLGAHCPDNVFMVVVLLHSGGHTLLPAHSRFFLTAFVLYQFCSIFGIHLMFTLAVKVIFRPRRRLCLIMAESGLVRKGQKGIFSGKGLISLSLLVYSFPAERRLQVGFTYGPFGQVTMGTFAKYVLLYGKFLLITHKWIRAQSLYQRD